MLEPKKTKLKPTLWRTCRVLMNEMRLNLLRRVYENDDKLNVSQLARLTGMGQPVATNYLRALNARGLIGVRRERIRVFYNTNPDRSLPQSIKLRDALFAYFQTEPEEGWERNMMILLKAYTHFNRLAIINWLAEHGPSEASDLDKAMGVCVKSVEHHLRYLIKAGVVKAERSYHEYTVYRLVPPQDIVSRTLLELTLDSDDLDHYFNVANGDEKDLRLRRDVDGFTRVVDIRKRDNAFVG